MSWNWKQKPTWRKDLITYNSHYIFFKSIGYHLERKGVLLETECLTSKEWKNFRCSWTWGWEFLKIGKFFMEVICVSSLSTSNYWGSCFSEWISYSSFPFTTIVVIAWWPFLLFFITEACPQTSVSNLLKQLLASQNPWTL